MRCYYEELGVARDSNEVDIKSAYRKLALRWHPDKNPDSLEEAKERFQLIQQAYEVLSDLQERAWYDNHREQILRGKNSEYKENSLDVFQYFSSSCYKGYGDDENSFYSVYRKVFENIAAEDIEFMDDDKEIYTIPTFGNANSSYEDTVGPFYAYWQAYSTKKTYEWLCPYDMLDIKERYILRKVEKELKKIVQKARKERNDEVRNLVSFVRKRDRRAQAYKRVLEERAEANRLKQEEKRKEHIRKRQQDLAAARDNKVHNEGYEEQLKLLEQQYGSESDSYTDEDGSELDSEENLEADEDVDSELEYTDSLYCVACNKAFKNANARANHEESKKHRENVERLRVEMQAEEDEFNDSNELEETNSTNEAEQSLNDLQLNGSGSDDNSQQDEAACSAEKDAQPEATAKRNKKSKKSKKFGIKKLPQEDDDTVEDFDIENKTTTALETDSDDDWSKGNANKKSAKKSKSKKTASNQKREAAEVKPAATTVDSIQQPKPASDTTKTLKSSTANNDDGLEPQHMCVTCQAAFDSKNKLFAHLKKTNHGVYIPKAKPVVEGKPPKSKGKRK